VDTWVKSKAIMEVEPHKCAEFFLSKIKQK